MATAYESDNDTPVSVHMSGIKKDDSSTRPREEATTTTTCTSSGFCSKNYSSLEERSNDIKHNSYSSLSISDEVSNSASIENDRTSSESDLAANSNIVSILSDYYSYAEHIKQDMQEQNKPVEQVRLSLLYIPCLKDRTSKQPVFSQSSSIAKATDIQELLVDLNNVSSWFNYGLMQHLSVTMKNGVNMQDAAEEQTLFDHQYFETLNQLRSQLLSTLPSVSTGPQLHDDFEEVLVFVAKDYKMFTLEDTIFIHHSLANILGLRAFIVLFQGISESERNLSELVFWIPKSVAAPAITTAYQNELEMMKMGIIKVQTQYKTFGNTAIASRHEVHESGYETIVPSNTTDDDNDLLSSSHIIEEDEVFISPDSSGTFERVSTIDLHCTIATSSDEANSITTSASTLPIVKFGTHILIPPSDYTSDDVTSVDEGSSSKPVCEIEDSTDTLNERKLLHAKINKTFRSKQIHLDTEILQEIERQNLRTSPLENVSLCVDTEQPYIAMNSAITPITTDTPSSLTSYRSSPFYTPSQNHSPLPKHNPHYQTPPRRYANVTIAQTGSQLQTPTSSCTQTRTGSFHHYKNIPISFIRVPLDNTISQSLHFRVLPQAIPTSFVKRILLRSTSLQPANIQLIVISNHESNDEQQRLMVRSGDKVTGLYALENDIVVMTTSGRRGRVPYTSCRISKAFYGKNAKIVTFSTLSLYIISTLCIESFSSSHDTPLPVPIYMIIIKPFNANQRDELSVNIGDHLKLLFSNSEWVFGRLKDGRTGFIPREHCRPVTKSIKLLSQWIIPSLPFQSDFMFNFHDPPPHFLLIHPLFLNKEAGNIVMATRNYTPPGTQVLIRKGVCMKTIYCEGHFKYVATISGSSFWIPSAYTIPAPSIPRLPVKFKDNSNVAVPLYSTPKLRNGRNIFSSTSDSEVDGKNSPKKKVSFALTIFRSSMGSNPELAESQSDNHDPAYSVVVPTRRTSSNDNIPVYTILNNISPISSTFGCGCFKF